MQQYYPLSFFEKLIHVDLQQMSLKQKQPDKNFFSQAVIDIVNEKNNILERTGKYLYDLRKKKQVGWFIQHSQQHLVILMDKVAANLSVENLLDASTSRRKNTWSDLYKITYTNLAEILAFLEQKFERYLDINCKIPASYLLKAQVKFQQDVEPLKEGFNASGIDEQLQKIVFMPFLELSRTCHTTAQITYLQLHYLTEMNKRLFELLDASEEKQELCEKLHDLLLFINFNSVHYFEYWVKMVTVELMDFPTIREKLDRLMFLQKKASQATSRPAIVFNTLRPPLQGKMQSWLAEEIAYYKEIGASPMSIHLPDEFNRWKDFKIQTVFSVPQLGHILKLLLDSGLYLNKNRSEVLDFFSYFFTSVKQDNVSPGSLRSNFYKDDAAVSKAVRDILLDLVNRSHRGMNVAACFLLDYFLQQF
ncbi:hypothetical protein [Chitinophaga flava]|nr:hypothetical protein [Chitinophaga flava]